MSILYAIPTLNQLDWVLEKHVPSIADNLIDCLVIHQSDFNPDTVNEDRVKLSKYPVNIKIVWTRAKYNLGVAASWNMFLRMAFEDNNYDAVIIANDDIILGETTIQGMLDAAKEHPEALISAGKNEHNSFSLFYLNRHVFNTIGFFDEQFYPAYFEDNDYRYRMLLNNVPLIESAGDSYYHKGSATINTYTPERLTQHHSDFNSNEFRYVQKWGGLPGRETITS